MTTRDQQIAAAAIEAAAKRCESMVEVNTRRFAAAIRALDLDAILASVPKQETREDVVSLLDQSAKGHEERLWLVTNQDGSQEIVTQKEKAGRGGFAPGWGLPYREVLKDFVRSFESSMANWIKFHAAYLKGRCKTEGPLGSGAMDAVHFIANGHSYTAYIGVHHKGNFLGFGGARYTITMEDGAVYETNNLWSGRPVPPALREVLRDNAVIKSH